MEQRGTFRRSNHLSRDHGATSMTFSPNHKRSTLFALRHGASHDLYGGGRMIALFLLGKVTVCLLRTASSRVAATPRIRCLSASASRPAPMAAPEIPQQTGRVLFWRKGPLKRDTVCTKQEVLHDVLSYSCLDSHTLRRRHPYYWMRRQQQHEGTCQRHTQSNCALRR